MTLLEKSLKKVSKDGKISFKEIKRISKLYGAEGINALTSSSNTLVPKAQDWLNKYRESIAVPTPTPTPTPEPSPPPPPTSAPQENYVPVTDSIRDLIFNSKVPHPQDWEKQGDGIKPLGWDELTRPDATSPVEPTLPVTDTPARYSESEYAVLAQGLLNQIQGDIELEKQQIAGTTATKVADIEASALKYGYDRDVEAKKYLADQDYLKGTEVEKIRGQSNLNLQAVINAGLKDVEGVRKESAAEVATIAGEYGVKQEAARQTGQKEIANIGSQSSFRNALIGAFSF